MVIHVTFLSSAIAGRRFIWKLPIWGDQEVPGCLSLQEQELPILPVLLFQMSGGCLDGEAKAADISE